MVTDTSYITSGNRADLVKLIKDYALFLWNLDDSNIPEMPDSEKWTPPEGKKPVGYNSEDARYCTPSRRRDRDQGPQRRHRGLRTGARLLDAADTRHRMPSGHRRSYFASRPTPTATSMSGTRPRTSNTWPCSHASTSTATPSCCPSANARSPTATT